jgi:hypothetical protein
MKKFLQWVEDNNLSLPSDVVAGEKTEVEAKPATSENTKRSGISQNYPDAYVRAQYPRKYFNPITATADGKLDGKMGS